MMHDTADERGAGINSQVPQVKGIPGFHELHKQLREDLKTLPCKKKDIHTEHPPEEKEYSTPPNLNAADLSDRLKSIEETKKIMTNFREKTSNYPKFLSYDGSVVLCVLLSLNNNATANMRSLPLADQEIIKNLLPQNIKDKPLFEVSFDEEKDFILKFPTENALKDNITIRMFNSIIHPSSKDLHQDVSIEDKGDQIVLGRNTSFNKKNIQKLAGVNKSDENFDQVEEKPIVSQKQSGKNAYEIRADVLKMAIEWKVTTHDQYSPWQTEDDVMELAKKFYKFVENKR